MYFIRKKRFENLAGLLSSMDSSTKSSTCVLAFFAVTALLGGCSDDAADVTDESDAEVLEGFIFSTKFTGAERVLSVVDSGGSVPEILLADADGSDAQNWLITEKENGGFNISNVSVGVAQTIDVVNDGVADKIHLAATGDFSGQTWSITSLGNSFCRLTNNFTGSEIALDIINDDNDNIPRLTALDEVTGQQWRIVNSDGSIATTLPMSQCSGVE